MHVCMYVCMYVCMHSFMCDSLVNVIDHHGITF